MTESRSELERAAAELADGKRLDLDDLRRRGALTARELDALELLQRAQLAASEVLLEDGFEMRGELGRGSMGVVYRAFDRSLRREVALKIIAPRRGLSVSGRETFVAEARLLASVRHPGIVQVYSIHEHEGGIRMALERIDGRDLEALVREQGPLSCGEAARIGAELCRALAALHERGITHRDLKPANVMRERGGRIVLLDFGVARSPSSSAGLMGPAGTPRFMAPEQFVGGTVGRQADLWALGAVLHWLVSARFPFEAPNFEELRRRVATQAPAPLVDHRADVEPRFAAVVARALQRDLNARHATAGEMEADLRALALEPSAPHAPAAPPAPLRDTRRLGVGPWILSLVLVGGYLALRSRTPTPLHLDAAFFATREQGDVRLGAGDTVAVGDGLVLEVSAAENVYLYVFDQDDVGEPHVLFPVPGFLPQNPLPAGETHRLPGRLGNEAQCWVVTSDGGGETISLVASRAPLAAMQELLATIPPVRPGEAPTYPELPGQSRTALLRGIGATKAAPRTGAAHVSNAKGSLDLGDLLERLEPAPGVVIRVLHLRSR